MRSLKIHPWILTVIEFRSPFIFRHDSCLTELIHTTNPFLPVPCDHSTFFFLFLWDFASSFILCSLPLLTSLNSFTSSVLFLLSQLSWDLIFKSQWCSNCKIQWLSLNLIPMPIFDITFVVRLVFPDLLNALITCAYKNARSIL